MRECGWQFHGAGAFHVTAFEAGKRVVLAATEDYRLGRPFVDSIEIAMGRTARDRIVDLELNKADFAEIPAEDARRAAERGVRVSRSQPDELLALVFTGGAEPGRGEAVNKRVREAIALSIDRAAIVNFILQKEGEPAGGLLPQWSSGTAFLFSTAADAAHAKELSTQIIPAPKIVLGYDFGDSLGQAVAERIAVNAREAGIAADGAGDAEASVAIARRSMTDVETNAGNRRCDACESVDAFAEPSETLEDFAGLLRHHYVDERKVCRCRACDTGRNLRTRGAICEQLSGGAAGVAAASVRVERAGAGLDGACGG